MTAAGSSPTPEAAPATARDGAGERPALVLRDLRKSFGGSVVAVDGVDLEVRRGEFVTLLGPSGSGKTTTLRMVAGFTTPTSGTIEVGGKDMTECRRIAGTSAWSSRTTPCSRT